MNRFISFIFCWLYLFSIALSQEVQTGVIKGYIISSETKQPLPFINVFIEGTKTGIISDAEGKFTLDDIPLGNYTLVFSSIGYEIAKEKVTVSSSGITTLRINLKESSVMMKEVQVTEEAMKKSLKEIRPSVVDMQPQRAKALPGGAEDVMRALQYEPGVLAPSDFRAALVVRGGSPDQNLVVMDGIEIFNPYRLYGLISMFNPETVTDISLMTGGFPAKYGDRLSAVVDVVNKRGGDGGYFNGSINASVSNANIVLEGRTPTALPFYWLVSARRTYYDLVLEPFAKRAKLVDGDVQFPNFSDVQGKFTLVPAPQHQIVVNGIASQDGVHVVSGENRQTPDSVSISNDSRNDVAGASWLYTPEQNISSRLSFSWYRNKGVSDFGGAVLDPGLDRERLGNSADSSVRLYNIAISSSFAFVKYTLKEDFAIQQDKHLFEFGITRDWLKNDLYWSLQLSPELRARFQDLNVAILNNFLQTQTYYRNVMYGQDKWEVNDKLTIQPGIRLDYFNILDKYYAEPRLNLSYYLNPVSTVRAAWGIYYQSPGYEKLVDQNVFYSLTNANTLNAEQAIHYVLGFERWLNPEMLWKAETYYKKFTNLIVQQQTIAERFTTESIPGGDSTQVSGWTAPHPVMKHVYTNEPVNNSFGNSYGIEFEFEKKQITPETKFWGSISYALAWAERNVYGVWRPLSYDQRHTVNIAGNFKVNEWLEVALKWRYGSNYPYSPPVGIQPRIVSVHIDSTINGTHIDTTVGIIQTDSHNKVIFDIQRAQGTQVNSGRLPSYHRLDVRATAYTKIWGLDWTFYLDVINVYNRKNILNYQFFVTENLKFEKNPTSMFPILPTIGMSVKF